MAQKWGKTAILKAVKNFIKETGRIPVHKDFKESDELPRPSAIKIYFGLTTCKFLDKYYPQQEPRGLHYHTKSAEEWLAIFVANYNRIKPFDVEDYNRERDEGTPAWGTYAKMFGVEKWSELQTFAKVERYIRQPQPRRRKRTVFKITHHHDFEEWV